MTASRTHFVLTLLATALVLGLSACGKNDDKEVATQVAAKVDSEEISVHQINQVLNRTNSSDTSPQAVQAASQDVLEKLIEQQLAVNQAIESKLHRSPEVVSQIESARREILTRAYMQQVVGGLPKPTAEDAKKYYAEHPQLFAERRIFSVQEIVVPVAPGMAKQLRAFALAAKPIEKATAWLKGREIKFGGGSATRAAEQIPLELLARIHALKDGQSVVIETPQTITLLRVASSQVSPVDEATARPSIGQFLNNQRAGEVVAADIKSLRSNAKITYVGDFAKGDGADVPDAVSTAPARPLAQASAVGDTTKSSIEKGVAGLK
jgi:EpsD family peptidyl-prolyl cis-trans isomerase